MTLPRLRGVMLPAVGILVSEIGFADLAGTSLGGSPGCDVKLAALPRAAGAANAVV